MERNPLTYAVLLIFLSCACARTVSTESNNPPGNPTPKPAESQVSKIDDKKISELQEQIQQIASAAKGKVGVAAVVLETEKAVSLNPHDRFPMQSVYKLPISMAVMQQVDAGKLKLDDKVQVAKSDFVRLGQHSTIRDKYPKGVELSVGDLVRFAIWDSDGTASDVLLRVAGGAEVVQAYLNDLKVDGMVVANTEKEIGRDWQTQYQNWATPEAAVTLLRALHERRGLSEQSQALLQKHLIESRPGAQRLKGLLPAGTVVAHKTGTSGAQNGISAATNDIGIITLPNGKHLAIAVFVSDSAADGTTREAVIARIAEVVFRDFERSN